MHRLPSRRECAAEAAARHVPVNRPCPASAGNAEPRVYPRVRARGFPLLVVATFVLLCARALPAQAIGQDRKSTRLNSSHGYISYAVFCLKKKKKTVSRATSTRRSHH